MTHTIYDMFTAAYLLALGIPLVRSSWDGMVRFEFDNTDNRAAIAAQQFHDGNPTLPARDVLISFKTVQNLVRKERMGVGSWRS